MIAAGALLLCLLWIPASISTDRDTASRFESMDTRRIAVGFTGVSNPDSSLQQRVPDTRETARIDPGLGENARMEEAILKNQADLRRGRVILIIIVALLFIVATLIWIDFRARARTTKALQAINAQLTRQKLKLSETLEALKASEERYKCLVENSPSGIILLDAKGSILEVNRKMIEILGSPGPEETKQINCLEFDPLKTIGLADDILACLQSGKSRNRVTEYQSKWGKNLHLNYKIIPLKDKNDEVSNLILNVEDITDSVVAEQSRRESELKYRILVENSLQAMMIVQGGRVIFANKKMEEITRYPVDEIINAGRRWLNLIIHPDDKRRSFKNVKEALDGKDINPVQVYKIIRKDGETRLMETLSSVVKFHGHPAMLVVAIDITEQSMAKEHLVDSEKRLTNLNAMKDKFFSIIAHDLKNPFSSILGFSNLLYEAYDNFSEKQRKAFIKNICEASENTFKLLQNLLEWSRAQTGKIAYFPEVLDVEALIMDNVSILKSGFVRKNIELQIDIPHGVRVYADENMVKLVLRNLISNALKFTYPDGKVVLAVENNGPETIITVMDNGIGIEKDDMKRLFRIDDQLKTKGTANESGSGLGLILCKEFVEQNKGRIWVKSKPGAGSSFSFSLPANNPDH